MKNKTLSLSIILGIALGCAGSEFVRSSRTVAQVQQSNPAAGQFRECVGYRVGATAEDYNLEGEATPIPAGWTVVGGMGAPNRFLTLLCR